MLGFGDFVELRELRKALMPVVLGITAKGKLNLEKELGMVAHTYNPSTQEAEAGGS
jgi:hypothetical protein